MRYPPAELRHAGSRSLTGGLIFFVTISSMRVNVYVDGFNLYYGAVKGTPYKWLDLGKLCTFLLPGHSINRIRYFTALIQPRGDPLQPQRQQTYLRALETIPHLSVHLGSFLTKPTFLPLEPPPPAGQKTVQVLRTEEKAPMSTLRPSSSPMPSMGIMRWPP